MLSLSLYKMRVFCVPALSPNKTGGFTLLQQGKYFADESIPSASIFVTLLCDYFK